MRTLLSSRQILRQHIALVVCLAGLTNATAAPPENSHNRADDDKARAPADTAASNSTDVRKPVARVLGRMIYEVDVRPKTDGDSHGSKLSERKLNESRKDNLARLIWQPLQERYCLTHAVVASEAEIGQYNRAMQRFRDTNIQRLRAEWEAEETTDERRNAIAEELEINEKIPADLTQFDIRDEVRRSLKSDDLNERKRRDLTELMRILDSDGPDDQTARVARYFDARLKDQNLSDADRKAYAQFARDYKAIVQMTKAFQKIPERMVLSWKFDRALYAEFGGTVIFQQANPFEPVGAYHSWLKGHEMAGDFEIFDENDRARFWRYYEENSGPSVRAIRDLDPFDQPWWLKTAVDDECK